MEIKPARPVEFTNAVRDLLLQSCALGWTKGGLLATSGGQDSACLAVVGHQVQDHWRCRLGSISCNHLWQMDSFYALLHVARCNFWVGRPLCFATAPRGVTTESRARGWRYNVAQRVASLYHCQAISVGQTRSDLAETTLLNSFRGGGGRGLASLRWQQVRTTPCVERCHVANFTAAVIWQRALLFSPRAQRWPVSLDGTPLRHPQAVAVSPPTPCLEGLHCKALHGQQNSGLRRGHALAAAPIKGWMDGFPPTPSWDWRGGGDLSLRQFSQTVAKSNARPVFLQINLATLELHGHSCVKSFLRSRRRAGRMPFQMARGPRSCPD